MKTIHPLLKCLFLGALLALQAQAMYDPGQGRWVSRDPIGERGGVNLYRFVGNNGIDRADVLGLTPSKCCLKSLTINHRGVAGTTDMMHRFEIEALFMPKGTERTQNGETVCCDPARCLTKQELLKHLKPKSTMLIKLFCLVSLSMKIETK